MKCSCRIALFEVTGWVSEALQFVSEDVFGSRFARWAGGVRFYSAKSYRFRMFCRANSS